LPKNAEATAVAAVAAVSQIDLTLLIIVPSTRRCGRRSPWKRRWQTKLKQDLTLLFSHVF
jgi:hypothetical protein